MDLEALQERYFSYAHHPDKLYDLIRQYLDISIEFLANKGALKIHSDITLPELEKIFSDPNFPQSPQTPESFMKELTTEVVAHSVRLASPGYIGHMTGVVPDFAIAIEMLISCLNQNVVKIETALSASFIEGQTTAWLHRLVYNFDDAYYRKTMHSPDLCLGNVTSGGTIGNLTAMAVARNRRFPTAHGQGISQGMIQNGYSRAVILASSRVHYSIKKAAAVIGIGGDNVIEIPVHPYQNTIQLQLLVDQINRCKEKKECILAVVGVAGSTETGSIDDLSAIADICEKEKIWFHVDAAWGGPLLMSPSLAPMLKGIEKADSVVLDGHKLFYLPMSHGTVLFKDELALSSIKHSARYIIREGSVDLGRWSIEGSRRFDALKMWAALKILGRTHYGILMDGTVNKTRLLAAKIDAQGCFETTSLAMTNILTWRYLPSGWKEKVAQLRSLAFTKTPGMTNFNPSPVQAFEILSHMTDFLNELNVQVQKDQRQAGQSFVSRTRLESLDPGLEAVVFRAVPFNPMTNAQKLDEILAEQKHLAEQAISKIFPRWHAQLPEWVKSKFQDLG